MPEYGLIGENLIHSFSKKIHGLLGNYEYDLLSLDCEQFRDFFTKRDFKGVNITIPYKKTVMEYCDVIDQTALKIGAVNTVVNTGGKLYGYNTDCLGFDFLIKHNNFDFADKKVLILGNGGTSNTAEYCSFENGAKEIVKVSRGGDENFENIHRHFDADIIVNTTPVGMFPNNLDTPLELGRFKNCSTVIDVIYNPFYTKLLLDASGLGMQIANGLPMLIAQAKYAGDLFFCKIHDDRVIQDIKKFLSLELLNIVLVGMPSCGKTQAGTAISKMLCKSFVDTDSLVTKAAGMSIPEIFKTLGESAFRETESDVILKAGAKNSCVISTGGGAVTDLKNYAPLKQN
ncbi:MAG: shikimate dehydrogenase, partial [Oscillospiraceae bacterium]|nr:shikimate dehydrogenase [Oscillospiraceae bacterium]